MAWRNFIRNRRATVAAVLAVAALVAFLLVFTDNIRLSEAELDHAYETVPVDAYITSSQASTLPHIDEDAYASILKSGFVAAHCSAARYRMNTKDTLYAVDSVAANGALQEYVKTAEWMDGYDETLFAGSEAVCVIPRAVGMALGEPYTIPLQGNGATLTLTVVGLYGSGFEAVASEIAFYCPLATLRDAYHANDIPFYYCFLQMDLCNTRELAAFKEQMQGLGMQSGNNRLVVNDALLVSVTTELKKHIDMLSTLLPALYVLVAAIGFALSFLLLRGRRREAAVLRSIGTRRAHVFLILLLETCLQAAFGALLGALAALCIAGPRALEPGCVALVFGIYSLGGAAAVLRFAGVNVLELMAAKE